MIERLCLLTLSLGIGLVLTGCQHGNPGDRARSVKIGELTVSTRKPPGRTATYLRGTSEVQIEYSLADGRKCRFLLHDGRRVVAESDKDGDGFLETVILFPEDLEHAEVFRRLEGGEMRPIESVLLRDFRLGVRSALNEYRDAQQP